MILARLNSVLSEDVTNVGTDEGSMLSDACRGMTTGENKASGFSLRILYRILMMLPRKSIEMNTDNFKIVCLFMREERVGLTGPS